MFLKNSLQTYPIRASSKATHIKTAKNESIFTNNTLENKNGGEEPIIFRILNTRSRVNGNKNNAMYTKPKVKKTDMSSMSYIDICCSTK